MSNYFDDFSGKKCSVKTAHKLFGFQKFIIDSMNFVNPDLGFGVRIKNQDIYIPRKDIEFITHEDNLLLAASNKMIICIKRMK